MRKQHLIHENYGEYASRMSEKRSMESTLLGVAFVLIGFVLSFGLKKYNFILMSIIGGMIIYLAHKKLF